MDDEVNRACMGNCYASMDYRIGRMCQHFYEQVQFPLLFCNVLQKPSDTCSVLILDR